MVPRGSALVGRRHVDVEPDDPVLGRASEISGSIRQDRGVPAREVGHPGHGFYECPSVQITTGQLGGLCEQSDFLTPALDRTLLFYVEVHVPFGYLRISLVPYDETGPNTGV